MYNILHERWTDILHEGKKKHISWNTKWVYWNNCKWRQSLNTEVCKKLFTERKEMLSSCSLSWNISEVGSNEKKWTPSMLQTGERHGGETNIIKKVHKLPASSSVLTAGSTAIQAAPISVTHWSYRLLMQTCNLTQNYSHTPNNPDRHSFSVMPRHVSAYGHVYVTHIWNVLQLNNNVVSAECPHQKAWERWQIQREFWPQNLKWRDHLEGLDEMGR